MTQAHMYSNWRAPVCSMEVSTVVVSACVAAVACAGAYVLWGPDQLWKRPGRCAGLVNLGNTCFLNAILQALSSLPEVREWLERATQLHTGRLMTAMAHVTAVLAGGHSGVVHSPVEVLQSLVAHHWTIDFQQQDAHELYHVLLMTLEEEMVVGSSLLTDTTSLLKEETPLGMAWTRTGCVAVPKRPLVCPLQGLLASELLCCHCHYLYPSKYESFDSLSLPLPSTSSQCSLQNCLLDFVKSEVVSDVECPHCSKEAGVSTRRTFLKQLWLGRLPGCLCIHFKRTVVLPDGGLYKDNRHVSFPLRLDVGGIVKRKTKSLHYQLVSVLQHTGGVFSGHYVTYRCIQGAKRNQWVYTSDTSVCAATIQEVLGASAYMLFYSRVTA